MLLAGRYRIGELVGSGGAGWVYEAIQEPLGRAVAVKLLRTDLPEEEQIHFEARFLREASLAGKLQHPNIVTIHDYGRTEEGFCYLVMEFLQGHTLRAVLRRHTVSPQRVLRIFDGIAKGLRHAHTRGLVHRDIKPSNILLIPSDGDEWLPKITDFGLVRAVHAEVTVTEVGTFLGTPQYISPEQARGETADVRSDVYSLGVMLYRALCGKLPYAATNPAALAYMHVHEPYPPMHERAPGVGVPARLEAICERAMRKDPAGRCAHAGAFLQELRQAARVVFGPEVLPAPDGAGRVAAVALKPSVPGAGIEDELGERIDTEEVDVTVPMDGGVWERSRRRRVWMMVPAALLVILVCGGVGAGLEVAARRGLVSVPGLQGLARDVAVDAAVEPPPAAPPASAPPPELVEGAAEPAVVSVPPPPPDPEPAPERRAADESLREALAVPAQPVAARQDPPPPAVVPGVQPEDAPEQAVVSTEPPGGPVEPVAMVEEPPRPVSAEPVGLVIEPAPDPGPPGLLISAPGAMPAVSVSQGAVTVDQVSFTADEARRTLDWVNSASEKQLKQAGVYTLGVANVLAQRPYATLEVFAATHYIGTKSVQAAKYAALR